MYTFCPIDIVLPVKINVLAALVIAPPLIAISRAASCPTNLVVWEAQLLDAVPKALLINPPLKASPPISPTVPQNSFALSLLQHSRAILPVYQVAPPTAIAPPGPKVAVATMPAPTLNPHLLHLEISESIVSLTLTSPPLS